MSSSASSPRATGSRHALPHSTRTLSRWLTPSPGHFWLNRCVKLSNAASPQNASTALTTTRAQGTTHSVGESPMTMTTATATWREPLSARPTQAS